MKKGITILMALILSLACSCNSSSMELSTKEILNSESIFIETEETEYKTDVEIIWYSLFNNTDDGLFTDYRQYRLEKYESGEWYTVPFLPSKRFIEDALGTYSGKTSTVYIDIKKDFGKLKKGKYRILHPIGFISSAVYVTAEFEVS